MGSTTSSRPDAAGEARHDRNGLRILDRDECLDLLASQPVGRLAFVLAGRPMVLPVNFALDGGDIVFKTGAGSKLATALRRIGTVAFEVDDWETDGQTGWSVLVQGSMDGILDLTEMARLEHLGLATWLDTRRPHWIRLTVERISGRAIEPRDT